MQGNRLNIVLPGLLLSLLAMSPQSGATTLESANAARDRAQDANAQVFAPDEWTRAERSLAKAHKIGAKSTSSGKIADAYSDAIEDFDVAELQAIDTQLIGPARDALRAADELKAKRYAPVTREQAIELLARAETAVATDRYAIEEITALADEAAATARYAGNIAAIARDKPDTELLLRRWDSYLDRIAAAGGLPLATDADPEAAVEQLEARVGGLYTNEQQLKQDLADSQAFVAALEAEIRELDQKLGGASDERRELVMQIEEQARTEEQFQQTEALFEPSEAIVFRQSDAVVLRLFGLDFAPGSAELTEVHEPLLSKIERAISVYPGASLLVEGHTDSQGSDRLNLRLSQNRADAVLNYMIINMKVAPNRIAAKGYGASQPIANNQTEEGRAKNRRIDLLIKPSGS